ncbi:MAG: MFS transporter [Pseudobacter sp.]|uniref:MFS transporter n=1 Tax=Pseudobacter sp. TaxID=2045420 RepID=UPI003F822AB1
MQPYQKTTRYRWFICSLLFFATTINYIDRQVLGLLKPVLEKQFGWSEMEYSYIVMAFTASYAVGLVVFGRIIDRIGTKLGYTISITIWSIAAMLHAAVRSTFGFGAARAALGIGESGNFPAAIKTVAEWFPKKERALATGILDSGSNIGACVAPVLVPWILGWYGWQEAFIITGALGFIWLIIWRIFYTVPSKQARISASELAHINSDQQQEADEPKLRWAQLFRLRQTWAFIAGKFFTDPIWYFFMYWLPSYFSSTFHLDLKKPSLPLVIVYSATTIGAIGGGLLSSWLIKRGWNVGRSRKFTLLISALLVLPVMAARYTDSMWTVVILISIAVAGNAAWSANIYTIVSDMLPRNAVSSVIGIGGMAGAIGGVLFPLAIGGILEFYKSAGNITQGYNIIFIFCGLSFLLAWLVLHWITPRMTPYAASRKEA